MSDLKLALQTQGKDMTELGTVLQAMQPRLPRDLRQQVEMMVPELPSYQWHSQENLERARGWFEAMALASVSGKYQQCGLYLGQVADVFHFDRAEKATALTRPREKPIRFAEVPQSMNRNGENLTLNWIQPALNSQFPMILHSAITNVLRRVPADELWLADYIRPYYGTSGDPILYARYGEWYVKLAEWE